MRAAALALALLAAGCGGVPFSTFAPERSTFEPLAADSVRYVNAEGTPAAVATVWAGGTVNVACEVHDFVVSSFPSCTALVRGTVAWRGTVTGGEVAASGVTFWSHDSTTTLNGGPLTGTLAADTLRVAGTVESLTPCGSGTTPVSLTLVRVAP